AEPGETAQRDDGVGGEARPRPGELLEGEPAACDGGLGRSHARDGSTFREHPLDGVRLGLRADPYDAVASARERAPGRIGPVWDQVREPPRRAEDEER